MPSFMKAHINATRNGCRFWDEMQQRAEARRHLKLFLAPRDAAMSDAMVPDYLVSESMIDRYFAIEPPLMRSTTEFDPIIGEIETAYVLGLFFSALSASVVTIERLLNTARIELHQHVSPKIKALWNKDSTNDWQPNIDALSSWKYVSDELAEELPKIYGIRCHYLHSGDIATVEVDSLQAVRAAYRLLNELIGFPSRLFRLGTSGGWECLDPQDPLVRVFYTPNAVQESGT
jgi:hypothetical protein